MTETASKFNCPIVSLPGGETIETIKSGGNREWDRGRDNSETISLKALAIRHFSRDRGRDKGDAQGPGNTFFIVSPPPVITKPDGTIKSGAATPEDAAYIATERAAIIAESQHGNACHPVPHVLPPSWGDARIEPTAGARCHVCRGASWWCESVNPTGWRCGVCHPHGHLIAGEWREVVT